MSTKAIPILVSGAGAQVGAHVVKSMAPEYEVIHFTFAAAATKEIPLLLKREVPKDPSSDLGSGNWDVFPKALVFGGAYKDEMIEDVRKAVAQTEGVKRIPWLRVDNNKPHPPPETGADYASLIVSRLKAMLMKLEDEGKFDADDDSLYLF
ncbi:hypothetical protein R3P38DRAFT_2671605 [Favolaschia claudopus]|uniref:NAD(P)-binding domain-containing protein n=1 Tax=Favolaschia claudopus TaxID=2862362 RepID=A0AAV9Z1Y6_9AGAR